MDRVAFRGGFFAVALLLTGGPVYAGPIQDYFAQKVETPGGYYEGQRRGYATGGGFNARWRSNSDYLASVEKPRLKAGCGGIDAFYGGFSFVKAEYLVQKLQQMAQNAPAVFLDLAIAKMMQDLSNSMKSIDALTESLNGIQLDDCKATKAIIAGKPGEILEGGEQMAQAYNDFQVNGGLAGMYDEAKKAVTNAGGAPPSSDKPPAGSPGPLKSCSPDLDLIFLTPNTTILGQIAFKRGYNADYASFMRGYMGDVLTVEVVNDNGAVTIGHRRIDACPQNDPRSVEDLATGNVYTRPPGVDAAGNPLPCEKATFDGSNFIKWATNQVGVIRDKIRDKTALTAAEKAFLDAVPEPVLYALIKGIQNRNDDVVVVELGQSVGRMYAYSAMRDFYIMITRTLHQGVEIVKKSAGNPQCQVSRLQPVLSDVHDLTSDAYRNITAMHGEYARAIAESNQSHEHAKHYDDLRAEAGRMAGEMMKSK